MTRKYISCNKISLFIPDLEIGGAEKVFVTLANQIVLDGVSVEIILVDKRGLLLDELSELIRVVDLEVKSLQLGPILTGILTFYKLYRYVWKNTPEVMISTLTGANLVALLVKLLSIKKYHLLIREASSLINVKNRIRLIMMKYLYQYSDKVIVLTEHIKKEMISVLGIDSDKFSVIGNPVNAKRITELAAVNECNKNALSVKSFCIGIGRLVEPKDFNTAIRAIAHVNTKARMDLVLLGGGDKEEELRFLTKSLGLTDRIHFLGEVSNPYPWLKCAKVFILSSKWEGFPNVLLEAMVLKCLIVATAYDSSVIEILSDYPDQLYRVVEVGDIEGMGNAVLDLMNEQKVPSETKEYSPRSIVDKYYQCIDALDR